MHELSVMKQKCYTFNKVEY